MRMSPMPTTGIMVKSITAVEQDVLVKSLSLMYSHLLDERQTMREALARTKQGLLKAKYMSKVLEIENKLQVAKSLHSYFESLDVIGRADK